MGAVLVAALKNAGTPLPRFVILISGFGSPCPEGLPFYPPAEPLEIPSLHIFGRQDTGIPPELSRKLSTFFSPASAVLYEHEGGHFMGGDVPPTSNIASKQQPTKPCRTEEYCSKKQDVASGKPSLSGPQDLPWWSSYHCSSFVI